MSILGGSNDRNMGTPFFHEFKKQASFFLKDKIRTARLALTDVTPAELMTEEATNDNPCNPDTRTMGLISRAAFEVDDYWRIVEILHRRLQKFDRKSWRVSYKALILLEHLLTHGPESAAEEFRSDMGVMKEMEGFQYIDERGFNWGIHVRKISERILKLLEKGPLLKEERDRARKITRGIKGFGSFSQQSSTARESSSATFGRCNSDFIHHVDENNQLSLEGATTEVGTKTQTYKPAKDPNTCWAGSNEDRIVKKSGLQESGLRGSSKENVIPIEDIAPIKIHGRNLLKESKPLLGCQKDKPKAECSTEEDHPFNNLEHQGTKSLLSARD